MQEFPTTMPFEVVGRPDEDPISFGGRWTIADLSGYTGLKLSSGGIMRSTAAAQSGLARWNVQQFGPGSEAWVRVATESTDDHDKFILINMTNPGASYNGYLLYISRSAGAYVWQIYRSDAGTLTQLGANVSTQAMTSGDGFGARAKGGQVEFWYYAGSSGRWQNLGSRSDSAYTTGYLAFSIGFGGNNTTVFGQLGGGTILPMRTLPSMRPRPFAPGLAR